MYFNQLFRISAIRMRKLGVFNREIGTDSKMFVDPKLLEDATEEFAGARNDILKYFSTVIALIKQIKVERDTDLFWVAARNSMQFKETSNTGLGCAEDGTEGNAIGKILASRIISRARQVLPHVDYQPEVLELIGVFTEGLGCDRISDMVVAILKPRFLAYTSRVTTELQIQQTVKAQFNGKTYIFPQAKKGEKPIILVPRSLLRPLPIAADLGEALDNADLNDHTRQAANKMFADARERGAAAPTTNELRSFIVSRPTIYKEILEGYKRARAIPYDFDLDPRKVSDFDPIAAEIVGAPKVDLSGLDAWGRVRRCVTETISHLRQSIEDNRLSDVLYDDQGKPRKELIAQRVIFAIAKIFGKLCNVDVARESNSGPGPVDFRFSVGDKDRLLVETKLSTHERLKDGYYEQLPAYGRAEGIKSLILLVIRVSDDDKHIKALKEAIARKSLAIQVIGIDAVRKPSASKRRTAE
ncbi:MAG: hypothetical protein ACLQHF_11265 [Terracidiphilus sp.]